MLIDFTIENFRSIKGPVTLSAIAQSRGASRSSQGKRPHIKPDNEIAPAFPVEGRGFELLPALGIFGANASGKTNVVIALDNLLTFLRNGGSSTRENFKLFVPFRLDAATAKSPMRFEIRVLAKKTIYHYTLAVNSNRILLEELDYLPPQARRFRSLYRAEWSEALKSYRWENGPDFTGPQKKFQSPWSGHEPFLALFHQFTSPPIQDLIDWLQAYWTGVSLGQDRIEDEEAVADFASLFPGLYEKAVQIIARFDTGLTGIRLERNKKASDAEWTSTVSYEDLTDTSPEYELLAQHRTATGLVEWPFAEESGGTRSLYPLVFKMLRAFEVGGCIIVDELGANMHPNLTHEIVRMFQNPATNPKRAQLIFTSHDNTLMRGNLLRRDQIWFTAKQPNGSTDLYSLSEFKPRNDLAIERAYLDGRFGAVPILPAEDLLLEFEETKR